MKIKLLIAICLLAVSGVSLSQMTPQMQQQLPPNDPNSSQYHSVYLPSLGQGDTVQSRPQAKWEDRWGAIAADGNAVYGIVTDMASKRQAQNEAVAECKRRGGGGCEVRLAYYNQCAAVAASTKVSTTYRAPYEEEAKTSALRDCEAKDKPGACWIYYSGCSLPVRVQ